MAGSDVCRAVVLVQVCRGLFNADFAGSPASRGGWGLRRAPEPSKGRRRSQGQSIRALSQPDRASDAAHRADPWPRASPTRVKVLT